MSIINATPLLAASGGDYQISRSVRLRSSASAYFNRTPASAGNRKTWTWSGWVKRGTLGTDQKLFSAGLISGTYYYTFCSFNSSNNLVFYNYPDTASIQATTSAVFRDPSAWYHIVFSIDTTQATNSNGVKIWVNGVQQTLTFAAYSQNADTMVNTTSYTDWIGKFVNGGAGDYFDGYLTEVNFIDGQALTPSSFGETDSITGVWKPKKYAGTYGTNGFYLNFSDPSAATAAAIGKDYSGNGNNWTPNNISVTAGVTYDSMLDVPTLYADGGNGRGNYAVLNPLLGGVNNAVMTNGNLTATLTATSQVNCHSTIPIPTTGKWYAEVQVVTTSSYGVAIGIERQPFNAASGIFASNGIGYYNANGNKYVLGTASAYGSSWYGARTDLIGISVDMDSGSVHFYLNGVDQGAISFTTGDDWFFGGTHGSGSGSHTENWNFGQRPFAYTPPTGFKALNTQNLPDSTIKAGNKYFDVSLYTGTGSAQSIVNGGGFQPDLVWVKIRNNAGNHVLSDSIRGTTKQLFSSLTDAEQTRSDYITAFDTSGFSVGAGSAGTGNVNSSGGTFAAWQWKAGGTAVSNTTGSITSQVSANPTAGFSIVTYTGTGVAATVGHGLGVAPKMMIVKSRSSAGRNWIVYHESLGATKGIQLNLTGAASTVTGFWNNTAPTSSVFTVGGSPSSGYDDVNLSAATYVAYCFAEVPGFSKFGSYTGNGSADGPFVYCGFRPKFVMIKRTDAVQSWNITDTGRKDYNYNDLRLLANDSGAEEVRGSTDNIDMLSNGFKIRSTATILNGSGGTYIFMAFAENPFRNSLAR